MLPENCRVIGKRAFACIGEHDYGHIDSFTLPYGVEAIQDSAFYQNDPITEYYPSYNNGLYMTLRIPSSVKTLGKSCFEGMRTLCTIFIPGSIKNIPERAFVRWFGDGQMQVYLGEGIETIGIEAFRSNGGKKLTPYGTLELGLQFITIPSTVHTLYRYCLADFQCLRTLSIAAIRPPAITLDGGIMPLEQMKNVWLQVPKAGYNNYAGSFWERRFERLVVYMDGSDQFVKLSQNLKEGDSVKGEGSFLCGSMVTIEATPAKGYRFAGWMHEGRLATTQPVHTFYANINSPEYKDQITYMAVFEPEGGRTTTKPDPIYRRADFNVGEEAHFFGYHDMSLYRGAKLDLDWVVDGQLQYDQNHDRTCYPIKGKYVHAHPDKYPVEVLTNLGYCYNPADRYSAGVMGIHFPQFPMSEEYDSEGNLLPGATLQLVLPIRNVKTGERDSVMFTTDLFLHGTTDPILLSGMDLMVEQAPAGGNNNGDTKPESTGSTTVQPAVNTNTRKQQSDVRGSKRNENGPTTYAAVITDNYYELMPQVAGLDRVNGFDYELVVNRSRYDKKLKRNVTETVDSIGLHYGPNELSLNDTIFSPEDYNWARTGLNSRFIESGLHLRSENIDRNYDYFFTVRARNYNANGTPRKWVQDMYGKQENSINLSKLEVLVGDTVRMTEEVTNVSNERDVQELIRLMFDYRYPDLTNWYLRAGKVNSRMNLRVNGYPSSWGKCQILMDKAGNPDADDKVVFCGDVKKSKNYNLTFPSDGKSHRCYLYWPNIDLTRTVVFTDHTPQAFSKYRFNFHFIGAGKENVKDLYMIYETDDGAINTKVIPKNEYSLSEPGIYPKRIGLYHLEESRRITRVISIADTVPLSEGHTIPVPASLDKVKSWRDWVATRRADCHSVTNDIILYGMKRVNVRLVDAETGKQITDNIAIDVWYPEKTRNASVKDGILGYDLFGKGDVEYILAKGYVPIDLLDGIKVEGNKFSANGATGTIDKNGIGYITLPMRRKTFDGRNFFINNVFYRMIGTDSVPKTSYNSEDALPWECVRYMGGDTHLAYEGEFQPKCNGKTMSTLAITLVTYLPIPRVINLWKSVCKTPLVLEYQDSTRQTPLLQNRTLRL